MSERDFSRGLPPPDAAALAHSQRLVDCIRNEIAASGGRISFARYMELALYAPGLGYYVAGARKFGPEGDFVTAPELSPLFARCLARQCAPVLQALGGGEVLEFGAGSGRLAAGLLRALARADCLPSRYLILELSAELRDRQRATLEAAVPELLGRVEWLDAWPTEPLRGVAIANEVLDAMPVHRFRIEGEAITEAFVVWRNGRFAWDYTAPQDPRLAGAIGPLASQLPVGYESEINLHLGPWLQALGQAWQAGLVLLIDYGFPRREYYHPQRSGGTLICHYRHRSHVDPLILTGLQDITAHVDFTAVVEAAVDAGFELAGFTHQAAFLLALGLTEFAAAARDERERFAYSQQVQRLTSPSEMGELFKVMGLSKGLDLPLQGFALLDQRGRL